MPAHAAVTYEASMTRLKKLVYKNRIRWAAPAAAYSTWLQQRLRKAVDWSFASRTYSAGSNREVEKLCICCCFLCRLR